jgi:hypothetical protein
MSGMQIKRYLSFLGFTLTMAAAAFGQNLKVENVRFDDQGETIVIRYDLSGPAKRKYVVSLSLSYDYGKSFSYIPQKIAGDIGRSIRPGKGKEIIWRVNQDFPDGLIGDGFVFCVEAEVQKWNKTPLYAIGAGILGGALLFTVKKVISEPEPTTGSVTVIVPSDF